VTEAERALLLLVARAIYGDLDTSFIRRQAIKDLLDKVRDEKGTAP